MIIGDDGKPTDKRELTTIVGTSEDSKRRISPIAMLHYRMPYTRNVFASVGVTGKRDSAGTDLEYLLGPSFLFRNMFFTVGGYAGKQQRRCCPNKVDFVVGEGRQILVTIEIDG